MNRLHCMGIAAAALVISCGDSAEGPGSTHDAAQGATGGAEGNPTGGGSSGGASGNGAGGGGTTNPGPLTDSGDATDASPVMVGDAGPKGDGPSTINGPDASMFVPPPTCVTAATLPTWRMGMMVGEWKQLATADITKVTPTVQPSGGYYGRIDAWNGFASDTVHSIVYLGGAGGHADYAGNEVYTIDLNAAAPQWVIQIQPSPSSAYTIDQEYYTDGRPSPTHTYYTAWFIEQRSKFFRFAGGATWGTGNGATRSIDSWDPVNKTWDPAGTNPKLGTKPSYEMPTAKDFVTGDVYQIQSDNHLLRWNQASNTVTDLGNAAMGSDSFYDIDRCPMVADSANNRLILFSDSANAGNQVRIYDITAKTWSVKTVTGASAAEATAKKSQAMGYYDFCAKRIFIKMRSGGAVYQVDPTTLTATSFPTSGTAPPDAINGVHTLFQSLPKLGGYAYQPSHTAKLYFVATQ
jgi:hypothetical protein